MVKITTQETVSEKSHERERGGKCRKRKEDSASEPIGVDETARVNKGGWGGKSTIGLLGGGGLVRQNHDSLCDRKKGLLKKLSGLAPSSNDGGLGRDPVVDTQKLQNNGTIK